MGREDFLRAVHADDRGRGRAEFERCLGGGDFDVEFRVAWPDGSTHWLRDQGKTFAGPDGRPLFMAGAAVDITDRKRTADELRDADRRKDDFLALLAREGLKAVEMAGSFRPDVILMDVGMPNLYGYEATRRIRGQPWGRGMTVIALAGWGQEGDRRRSRDAGCDGHLVKPVGLDDLTRVLSLLKGQRTGT